ncbi:MAG: Uncharacterized protein G01um101431_192 [Parcubacteria group bacterium Gr01-1014_31]|nr:MAG: Uncharacterized protein G01um101431_192 [Parcubacteria group bacterium Gr01-1014_31]
MWYNQKGMSHSVALSSLKIFAVDLVGRVLFWPLWWYSFGLRQLVTSLASVILEEEHRLGVGLWWRNLFVPMYGQYDWEGRIISFVMRLFVGAGRTLLLVLWLLIVLAVAAVWIAAPIAAGYFIWRNFAYFVTIPWLVAPYGT